MSLGRAVELAAGEAETADHRQDLAGVIVERNQRALDHRLLLERDRRFARGVERGDADLDQIAGLQELGGVRAARPLIGGSRRGPR